MSLLKSLIGLFRIRSEYIKNRVFVKNFIITLKAFRNQHSSLNARIKELWQPLFFFCPLPVLVKIL